jgi:hypothetical protein
MWDHSCHTSGAYKVFSKEIHVMFTRIVLASFLAIAVLNGCATKKEPAPDPEAAAAAARAEAAATRAEAAAEKSEVIFQKSLQK